MQIDQAVRHRLVAQLIEQLKLPAEVASRAVRLISVELSGGERESVSGELMDDTQCDEEGTYVGETLWHTDEEGQASEALGGDEENTVKEPTPRAMVTQHTMFVSDLDALPLSERSAEASLPLMSEGRYVPITQLGQGGMGAVWRVYDRCLERNLALKVIREHLADQDPMRELFIREARLVAQLQHPAIIPIHDLGVNTEGQVCFVMDEVVGETLSERIKTLHRESSDERWAEGEWGLRRLADILYRASEAVAYAHSSGVTHRDLKPDNLLLGEHGEVWVIDWGLAGVSGSQSTRVGGTPRYMPPEQLTSRDPKQLTSPRLDVFSLGAVLYELLVGVAPFEGLSVAEIISRLQRGALDQLSEGLKHQRPVPAELLELCAESMSLDPTNRPAHAGVFSERLRDWLDGAKRQERARELVVSSQLKMSEARARSARSAELLSEASARLKLLPKNAPAQDKAPWWMLQSEAEREAVSSARLEAERYALLLGALMEDPTSLEAHRTLSARALERHRRAERARDEPEAQATADELTRHLERLPHSDLTRKTALSYLSGVSHFSLTLPVRADVVLERFVPRHKRLVAQPIQQLNAVDSLSLDLPIGSYRLLIRGEGCEEVHYPFFLERGCSWDEVGPSAELEPLPLPKTGELKPWERYVPRGWFYVGGDPEAPYGLAEHTLWVEGFIIGAQPVTHEDYLNFVNELSTEGRHEEALKWAPHEQASQQGSEGQQIYHFNGQRFEHPQGSQMNRVPVTQVSWYSARAYAKWLSERLGYDYRLPLELEWEKAARGVDRRCFPWGDQFDPSYCVMMDSHDEKPKIKSVESAEADCSPYEVRGCAGNIREWCLDLFNPDHYQLDELGLRPRFPSQAELESTDFKSSRGGSYGNAASRTRSADRDWWFPHLSYIGRGMRVARSYQPS